MGFGLLDPVDKNTAAYLHPGNQVAPLYAGGTPSPRRSVGGLVSSNKTLCTGVKKQVEPSVSVAQSAGGRVWMGGMLQFGGETLNGGRS